MLEAFGFYVSQYDLRDERILLKVRHTHEVAYLCDEIARGEGLPVEDVDLAWLCGLLHDIGRFEQLRRWGTFNDAASCSHAELGFEILEPKLLGSAFVAEWSDIVRKAVLYHSDLVLPKGLTTRERAFCNIVRDADKVDILRVFSESGCDAVLGMTSGEFVAGEISDMAMMGYGEHRCLSHGERVASLDRLVGAVCFVFELENPSAREAIRLRGYLQRLLDRPFGQAPVFDNPLTQQRWDFIREDISRAWYPA